VRLVIRKAAARDRQPATAVMTDAERRVATIFEDAATAFGNGLPIGDIQMAIRTGSADMLNRAADYGGLAQAFAGIPDIFASALLTGGGMPTRGLTTGSFNRNDPRALAFAQAQAGRLVTNVTDTTRERINSIIQDAFTNQRTVAQTAATLRSAVGLTERGERAVSNAYDREFQRQVKDGVPESKAAEIAQRTADVAAARSLKSRAMTIARTEIKRAENAGRFLQAAQNVESGLMDPNSLKEWVAGDCPICAELDGVRVQWDEDFPIGVQMPPAHPNCVCNAVFLPPDAGEGKPYTGGGEQDAAIDEQPMPEAASEAPPQTPEEAFQQDIRKMLGGLDLPDPTEEGKNFVDEQLTKPSGQAGPSDRLQAAETQVRLIGERIDQEVMRRMDERGLPMPADADAAAEKWKDEVWKAHEESARLEGVARESWAQKNFGMGWTEWQATPEGGNRWFRQGDSGYYDNYLKAMKDHSPEFAQALDRARELKDAPMPASTDRLSYFKTLQEVLGEVRPMGVPEEGFRWQTQTIEHPTRYTTLSPKMDKERKSMTERILQWYPRSWIQSSNARGEVIVKGLDSSRRGYHVATSNGGSAIHIPKARIADAPLYLHEMGHRMEDAHTPLTMLEWAWWRRRKGDEPLSPLRRLTNVNYALREVAVKDSVEEPYVMKSYSGDLGNPKENYEVFTMGYEALMRNKYGIHKDDDWRHFIIGTLAAA
jgi:Phage Mu protein F like protein